MTVYYFMYDTTNATPESVAQEFSNDWGNDNPKGDLFNSQPQAQSAVARAQETVDRAQQALSKGDGSPYTKSVAQQKPGFFKITISVSEAE